MNEEDELSISINEAKNRYFESMYNRKLYQKAKEIFD